MSLSKNIKSSLVLVQPRKTRPFITERLLMSKTQRIKSNKTKTVPLKSPNWNLYFRVMIARVEEKGNNTNDYYEAGVNIIPSLPLGGINPDTCGVDCLKDKLTMETMTGKWRGWQVCI